MELILRLGPLSAYIKLFAFTHTRFDFISVIGQYDYVGIAHDGMLERKGTALNFITVSTSLLNCKILKLTRW